MALKSVYGGLFQDSSYLSSDPDPKKTDPYNKEDCIPSRYLGKNMLSGHSGPGQHPDSYFDKRFATLASADQNGGKPVGYDDGATLARRAAMESKKKNISDREFRYASFPQKASGAGSYYGCFQNRPYEHMTEPWGSSDKGRSKRQKKTAAPAASATTLPNIKTNPPKRGTYGTPGVLLSNPAYNDNWREEYAARDQAEAKQRLKAEATPRALGPPFRSPGVSHAYLDELPNTGVSGVYSRTNTLADAEGGKQRPSTLRDKSADSPARHVKPFYGSTVRSGEEGCLNPFPNVWMDPAAAVSRETKKRRGRSTPQEKKTWRNNAVWKPNSFEKTSVISSCLRRFY